MCSSDLAESVDEARRLASLTHTLGDRLAAAMDQYWINTDCFKEDDITQQTLNQVIVLHRAATIFDDKRLAAEFLDKGKRFQKGLRLPDLGLVLHSFFSLSPDYSPILNLTYSGVKSVVNTLYSADPR